MILCHSAELIAMLVSRRSPTNSQGDRRDPVPDFNLGGYRFKDLFREGIVSSRGDLNYKQMRLGFPDRSSLAYPPLGTPRPRFMPGSPSARRCVINQPLNPALTCGLQAASGKLRWRW